MTFIIVYYTILKKKKKITSSYIDYYQTRFYLEMNFNHNISLKANAWK